MLRCALLLIESDNRAVGDYAVRALHDQMKESRGVFDLALKSRGKVFRSPSPPAREVGKVFEGDLDVVTHFELKPLSPSELLNSPRTWRLVSDEERKLWITPPY